MLKSFLNRWREVWRSPAAGDEAAENQVKSLVAARDRFYQLFMESAKGGLERATAGAQATRSAAAAIGVIYAAVLGVAFSVDKPLPPRGLIPAVFLGLAIVMATAYEAYPARQKSGQNFPRETDQGPLYDTQTYAARYVEWVTARINLKAYALRVAIMSLALGVAALPVGFISLGARIATPELPSWPDPPGGIETELAKTLYEAQVAEVALQREAILKAEPGESLNEPGIVAVYLLFAGTFLAILLHPIPGAVRRRLGKGRR